MSEIINNREHRQKILKEIIMDLHNGKPMEEVKAKFEKLIQGVSTAEISEMEAALIAEGMPVEEIQRLCDVRGSIQRLYRRYPSSKARKHRVSIVLQENRAIEELIGK